MRISLLTVVVFAVGVMAALIGLLILRSGGAQKDHKIRKRTSLAFFLIYSSLYPVLYIVTLKVLPHLKLELSGMAGPRTSFVCEAILNPVCFLVLGIVIGRHMAIVHTVIAAVISAWIYIQYPAEPLMNFARQMAYEELPGRLLAAYGAGFMYYLVYAVVSNRSHKKAFSRSIGTRLFAWIRSDQARLSSDGSRGGVTRKA